MIAHNLIKVFKKYPQNNFTHMHTLTNTHTHTHKKIYIEILSSQLKELSSNTES